MKKILLLLTVVVLSLAGVSAQEREILICLDNKEVVNFPLTDQHHIEFPDDNTFVLYDGEAVIYQNAVAQIDSVVFVDDKTGTLSFKSTNINSGSWDGYALYGDRLFATNTIDGIVEYKNGNWETVPGMPESAYSYPTMRACGGSLLITCPTGILVQLGDDNYYWSLWWTTTDYAGALGGSTSNFFAGAGTNGNGIFKWNGTYCVSTNQTLGCWYSIEALDENNVFFGAGASHVSDNYGVMRWDNDRQEVVATNLDYGVYNLAEYNDKMYTTGQNGTFVWNGSSFDQITPEAGKLKVAGNMLYFFGSGGLMKLNDAGTAFDLVLSSSYGYFSEIAEYQGRLYLFGMKIVVYNNETQAWDDVQADFNGNIDTAIPTKYGLFVSGVTSNNGILKMVPVY
ncbi:MAG: hypothetical protein FWF54_11355 [Candidatus Azobacteroides sp.]|nr:hypothetical protein [Candidatus Azobacteroides sp.]